jgi:ribosomal protein L37AE/L43A
MVKPVDGLPPDMTVVVDISCPECGETQAVRKVGIGRYECGECGATFDETQVEP